MVRINKVINDYIQDNKKSENLVQNNVQMTYPEKSFEETVTTIITNIENYRNLKSKQICKSFLTALHQNHKEMCYLPSEEINQLIMKVVHQIVINNTIECDEALFFKLSKFDGFKSENFYKEKIEIFKTIVKQNPNIINNDNFWLTLNIESIPRDLFLDFFEYVISLHIDSSSKLLTYRQLYAFSEALNTRNLGINIDPNEADELIIKMIKIIILASGSLSDYQVKNTIKNFGIEIDKDSNRAFKIYIEVLKAIATDKPDFFIKKLSKYKVLDDPNENELIPQIEIYKILAERTPKKMYKYMKTCFYLRNGNGHKKIINSDKCQNSLIAVAKTLANQGYNIGKFIENFAINSKTDKGEDALLDILKILANKKQKIAIEFKNFIIRAETVERQKALIEILQIAVMNGENIAPEMKNFPLDSKTDKGQEALIEIAKMLVINGHALSEYISDFKIDYSTPKGQQALIDIAKRAAINGENIAPKIKNFKIDPKTIKGEIALFEIAEIIAKNKNISLSLFISEFGIRLKSAENKEKLKKILRIDFQKMIRENLIITEHNDWLSLFTYKSKQLKLLELIDFNATRDLFILISSERAVDMIEHDADYYLFKLLKESLPAFANLLENLIKICKANDSNDLAPFFESDLAHNYPNDLIEKIKKSKNFKHQVRNINWLITSNAQLNLSLTSDQLNQIKPILNEIYHVADPILQDELISKIISVAADENKWNNFFKLNNNFQQKSSNVLATLFLCEIIDEKNVSYNEIESLSSTIANNTRAFKNGQNNIFFLKALNELTSNQNFTATDKHCLLTQVFAVQNTVGRSNKEKRIIASLKIIQTIISCKFEENFTEEKLKQASTDETIDLLKVSDQIFAQKFSEFFTLSLSSVEILEGYEKTFKNFANIGSLFVYAEKVKYYRNEELSQSLVDFIEHVLKGDYQNWRYNVDESLHLKEVFKGREHLLPLWQENKKSTLDELNLTAQANTKTSSMHELLAESFAHVHLPSDSLPILKNYLDEQVSEKKEMIENECRQSVEEKQQNRLHFQLLAIELSQTSDSKQKKEKLDQLIEMLTTQEELADLKDTQFARDLVDWSTSCVENRRVVKQTLFVEDTDHPEKLLMSGTDVIGSCQNIYGYIDLNRCLLDYTNDPKYRLIAITTADGKIKTRAYLRLLLKEDAQPALFLEQFYPFNATSLEQEAMQAMAMNKAKQMKIPLYSNAFRSLAIKEKNILFSKGSKAPFEYVDADRIGVTEGIYKISPLYEIC